MKTSRQNIEIEKGQAFVTIGMFDGVHRGHMCLVNNVVKLAGDTGGISVAVTFEPHPRMLLSGGDINLRFLTSLHEKEYLLARAGLDHLLVLDFNDQLRMMSACDFVERILVDMLGMKHLIVGYDHHFGYGGNVNSTTLDDCAGRHGFDVSRVDALVDGDVSVSSTLIRQLLEEGELGRANSLLGYEYILQGRVVEGKKIGRKMGYPTANIEPDWQFKLIPADGVYAVEVTTGENLYKAMLYIGTRPTLETGGNRVIEANLFGFDGDLYGKDLTIFFKHRIRGDMKFSSSELLSKQIAKDKDETLQLLG